MHSFEYAAPFTLQEAFTLLSPTWGETDILAGGTDLLSLMKQGIHQPRRVVSLKNVKDLSRIDRSISNTSRSGFRSSLPGRARHVLFSSLQLVKSPSTIAAALSSDPDCSSCVIIRSMR